MFSMCYAKIVLSLTIAWRRDLLKPAAIYVNPFLRYILVIELAEIHKPSQRHIRVQG